MGRAEIWGCSLHLGPDGTAWMAGVGQDELLLRAHPGTWLSQRRRTAAGKWPPGLERPHCSKFPSSFPAPAWRRPTARLQLQRLWRPLLVLWRARHPTLHFRTLSLIPRSLLHQPMNILKYFFKRQSSYPV